MPTTTIRTEAKLLSFIHRAAADLNADIKNARYYPEADYARRGRELCIALFIELTERPPAATN